MSWFLGTSEGQDCADTAMRKRKMINNLDHKKLESGEGLTKKIKQGFYWKEHLRALAA